MSSNKWERIDAYDSANMTDKKQVSIILSLIEFLNVQEKQKISTWYDKDGAFTFIKDEVVTEETLERAGTRLANKTNEDFSEIFEREFSCGLTKMDDKEDFREWLFEVLTNRRSALRPKTIEFYPLEIMLLDNFLKWLKKGDNLSSNEPSKLSKPFIALRSVYQGIPITRDNCKAIAKSFDHNSGHDLYQYYSYYSGRGNRTGPEDTKLKNKNKIELFENVINSLPENFKPKAIDDLSVLRSAIDKQSDN